MLKNENNAVNGKNDASLLKMLLPSECLRFLVGVPVLARVTDVVLEGHKPPNMYVDRKYLFTRNINFIEKSRSQTRQIKLNKFISRTGYSINYW